MDYLVKIRSVQTPLNGQFSIGANTVWNEIKVSDPKTFTSLALLEKYEYKIDPAKWS